MTWQVRLTGYAPHLEQLTESLSSADLAIEKDEEGYYLRSLRFDKIQDANQILAKGHTILNPLNGSLKLALGRRSPIQISHIVSVKDDGTRDMFLFIEDTITVGDTLAFSVRHQDGTITKFHPVDLVTEWLSVAQRDPNVSKALTYLARGQDNWSSLYHVYEIIKADLNPASGIVKKGYARASTLKRFTRTANSSSAAGETARHATENTDPPKSPMSLGEAKSFIWKMCDQWINDKR